MRPQHARAESVDRGDPRALGGARLLAAPELEEAAAHPDPHLGGGLLGEGDREYRIHPHPVLRHGPHEPLHEHGGLAGAGSRPHQQRAVAAIHSALLLGRQLAHRSLLQIEGYLQPPFQSHESGREQIAPPRIRASVSWMRPSAHSSFSRNSSALRRSLAKYPLPRPSTSVATIPRGRGSSLASATYTPPTARSSSSRSTTSM